MDTIALRAILHRLIDQINDDTVLQAYTVLLSREATLPPDFWDELSPAQQARIDTGLTDLTEGRFKPLADVLKKYK